MNSETDSDRRPARLVTGAVLVLLTLLISVLFIKHFHGQSSESAAAASGNDLTHSTTQHDTASMAAPAGNDMSAAASAPASAAAEPPNPFKTFVEHGKGAVPVQKRAPSSAAPSAATEPNDPFKAFLESGQQASAAAAPATPSAPPDVDAVDPFKEALERQQNAK